MDEPFTPPLEESSTIAGLAPQAAGLVSTSDHHGPWCQRGRGQPRDEAWTSGWSGSPPPSTASWASPPVDRQAARPLASLAAARSRSVWLPRATLDTWPDRRRDLRGIWHLVSSASHRPHVPGHAMESANAGPPGPQPACSRRERGNGSSVHMKIGGWGGEFFLL